MASEVDDLILLSKIDEENILNTLKNRLNKDIIYTLIGNVVISVNPYKNMESLYTNKVVESYKNKNIYEISPHIFALADNAFRDMKNLMKDQCVIISGESGAGKTEASKIFMKYITSVASNEETEGNKSIIQAKEQLLNSNPCLEAFGNSKTMRNDNSSRFGKYMDLQFDFNGIPTGGKITTYLLEKSRVVHITEGERTFHIFYQLLKGASDEHLKSLYLTREVKSYQYLSSSNCEKIEHVDDAKDFEVTLKSFNLIGIKNDKIFEIFDLIAAILHLGNINFKEDENGAAVIDDTTPLKHVSTLLGVTEMDLLLALTNSSIKDKKKESEQKKITVPLNAKKAILARDALSKQIYEKIFNYLVKLINSKLSKKRNSIVQASCNVIGVLDIYGFEIMNINSFEQFVINYCNEKLQQLFIELVLRSEQEEYAKEGIGWEEIKFFNNKTICDLIESKNIGIIALLDEECVMPGNPTDQTFLQKLNQSNFSAKHLHFDSYSKSPKSKLNLNCFRLRHYAGDVDYTVDGFIKKNKDKFNLDLIQVLKKSSNQLIKKIFEEDIREFGDEAPASNSSNNNNFGGNNKNMNNAGKKGESLATQFKSSMHQLMQNLSSKSPHYIRCIKSNALKAPDGNHTK
ncbi:Unconventional myosin-Ic [Lobulomyces angularis]|nr:Unconventional myosin-Ic [Lobulomyces angularis]